MKAILTTSRERATAQLRFVRAYLPRLLAASAHDPAVWVFALALQQLGEQVLAAHAGQVSGLVASAEHRHNQQALQDLGEVLRARYHVQQGLPRRQWETRVWPDVQQVLQQALARAEYLLQKASIEQENGCERTEKPD